MNDITNLRQYRGPIIRPASLPKDKARVTVTLMLAYRDVSGGQDPLTVSPAFGRSVGTSEQPVKRKVEIGPEWQPLELSWLKTCSFFVIENDELTRLQVVPSPEAREAMAARVIEIGVKTEAGVTPFAQVPPGEGHPFSPVNATLIQVRCRSGSARCTVTLFPA